MDDMNEKFQEELKIILQEDQAELVRLFAVYDCMHFAYAYLGTEKFEEEKQKYNHDKTLLSVGIIRAYDYIVQSIMTKVELINKFRYLLGMRLMATDLKEAYYQSYAIVTGEFDSDGYDPSKYTDKNAGEIISDAKSRFDSRFMMNLTDKDEDDSNSGPTFH